jgi:hypothetical protein
MKTTLVVAEPSDRLAQCVANLIPGVIRCSERELLDSCRFALLQDGTCFVPGAAGGHRPAWMPATVLSSGMRCRRRGVQC